MNQLIQSQKERLETIIKLDNYEDRKRVISDFQQIEWGNIPQLVDGQIFDEYMKSLPEVHTMLREVANKLAYYNRNIETKSYNERFYGENELEEIIEEALKRLYKELNNHLL